MKPALLLNLDMTPLRVLHWQRAIQYVVSEKVFVLEQHPNCYIRTPRLKLKAPSVIQLRHYDRSRARVVFCRKNILRRDAYTCQYCGQVAGPNGTGLSLDQLTIDHVVPKSRSFIHEGRRCVRTESGEVVLLNSWQNAVTACVACNINKGSALISEMQLKLLSSPKRPYILYRTFDMAFSTTPKEWDFYI